jgi:HEAT repeat protein
MPRHFSLTEQTPLEKLTKQLESGSRQQQYEAVEALGKLTDSAVVPVLIEEALKDRDSSVRWRAAQALARQGDPRAIEPLIEALRDEVPAVREQVVRALGVLEAKRAVPHLRQLIHDPDMDVSHAAVEALEQIGVRVGRGRPAKQEMARQPRPRAARNELAALLSIVALLVFLAALIGNLLLGMHFDLLWIGGLALVWALGAWLMGAGLNNLGIGGRSQEGGGVLSVIGGMLGLLLGLVILAVVVYVVAVRRLYIGY